MPMRAYSLQLGGGDAPVGDPGSTPERSISVSSLGSSEAFFLIAGPEQWPTNFIYSHPRRERQGIKLMHSPQNAIPVNSHIDHGAMWCSLSWISAESPCGAAMCRNIKTLFNFEPPATEEEIKASSLQFVRKLSGFTHPSKANQPAFDLAVEQVAAAARQLIESLVTTADPRDRDIEAARAKARSAARFG
jgi:hypothetical protein